MTANPEEIAKIQAILNKPSSCPDYRFTFGKYRGRLLSEILKVDKQYLLWLYHSDIQVPIRVEAFLSTLE